MEVSTPKTEGKPYASCASCMMQFSLPFLEWITPSTQKILQWFLKDITGLRTKEISDITLELSDTTLELRDITLEVSDITLELSDATLELIDITDYI